MRGIARRVGCRPVGIDPDRAEASNLPAPAFPLPVGACERPGSVFLLGASLPLCDAQLGSLSPRAPPFPS
jgi:hypothetical protein